MNAPARIALVTGASRGIGRAVAQRFLKDGYEVWALARSEAELHSLAMDGGHVHPLTADMADPAQVLAATATILSRGPTPSVLINNAGIAAAAPISKVSLEEFQRMQTINVTAPFLLCRELIPAMVKAGGGRVINIASTAAHKGFKYSAPYCASKHALLGMTRALAVEFASKKVTVNAVCPGWTDTALLAASAASISNATGRSTEEARTTLAQLNPMGRLISPEEVAELCFFLASPAAAVVTGASYLMDAGETV
ncbi:MAG: SDR family NAD(P)-dependent oxidoreductase [Myxococcaceae bacterium]